VKQGFLARLHIDRSAHRKHEWRHGDDADHAVEVHQHGNDRRGGDPSGNVESRASNQARDLGHLSIGAPADIAALRLVRGYYGFRRREWGAHAGNAEVGGRIDHNRRQGVWDLNGISRSDWRLWANPMLRAIRGGTGSSGRRIGQESNASAAPPVPNPIRSAACDILRTKIGIANRRTSIGGSMTNRFFAVVSLFTLYAAIASGQLATTTSLSATSSIQPQSVQNAKVTRSRPARPIRAPRLQTNKATTPRVRSCWGGIASQSS